VGGGKDVGGGCCGGEGWMGGVREVKKGCGGGLTALMVQEEKPKHP